MPRRRQIEDLRLALEAGAIVPYFQPIVDLKAGVLHGFEVLARRTHAIHPTSLPPDMISLADEGGLIGRVTEALLRQTAIVARTLPQHLSFAINISPSQFCEASFAKNLLSLTQEIGLHPSRLTIEVTESALMNNFDLALSICKQLKSYGAQLALDDFGTGYSSLRHLQGLPFDELKIDASFVTSMSHQRTSRKIVAAIIGLSHSMGLVTIAEGIETREQAEMLFYLGCGRGQGWLFGRPLAGSELASLVHRSTNGEHAGSHTFSTSADMIATTLEVLPAQRLSQLQAIYDGAPVGLCFLDRTLRYVSLNKRFTEAHARPVDEYLGRTVREVLPEYFSQIEPHLRRALNGEAVNGLEVARPDTAHPGRYKTYLVSYQPARDEVGEVIGISCVVVDISERKQAEDALRSSIDHYWRAAGSSPQIAWTADPQGAMIDVSPRWEIVTGLTVEAFLGHRWLEAVHLDDQERVQAWWSRSFTTGAALDMLFRLCSFDARALWIRLSGAPRCGAEGNTLRWYGTLELIDARVRNEGHG